MSVLNLKHCNLFFQPDLSQATALHVSLAYNAIHSLFNEYLPRGCKKLDIGNNRLASDGIPIGFPDTIEELYIDGNYIRHFDGIHWPTALRCLVLNKNPLIQLPGTLPDTLETLFCNDTYIERIDQLPTALQLLSVNYTYLRKLPASLPPGLHILEAHSNLLPSRGLPLEWSQSLRVLNLSHNKLSSFPLNLPDSLEQLFLHDNQIQEIPKLPIHLSILCIANNRIKRVHVEHRTHPLSVVLLNDNQLTESIIEIQEIHSIQWTRSIQEYDNWIGPEFSISARRIQRTWKRYRLPKALRAWLKTARVKQELIATAMHPSRVGRFEDIQTVF